MPRRRSKRLISFSGVDGAGKSTQIDLLEQGLRDDGHKVVRLWARGGYTPGMLLLKRLLRAGAGKRLPKTGKSAERQRAFSRPWVARCWLSISIIDMIFLYGVRVRWWLLWRRVVICDRYLIDTLLDFSVNFPDRQVARSFFWRALEFIAPTPALSLVFLLPVEESIERCRQKDEPFTDPRNVFETRLAHYREYAARADYEAIDGSASIHDSARLIRELVETRAWKSRPQVTEQQINAN